IGLGLAAASAGQSLPPVYAAYGLGVGLWVGCSYVAGMGGGQRRVVGRRGFASGLASAGIGVGTLAVPPFAAFLIDAAGWREAYLILGILAAIVGVGMALLIANDPRDRGLAPDGDVAPENFHTAQSGGASLREAIMSR